MADDVLINKSATVERYVAREGLGVPRCAQAHGGFSQYCGA